MDLVDDLKKQIDTIIMEQEKVIEPAHITQLLLIFIFGIGISIFKVK